MTNDEMLKATSGRDTDDAPAIRDDWDKFISPRLETANRFGGNAFVMSEIAVRQLVLDTLKLHGIK